VSSVIVVDHGGGNVASIGLALGRLGVAAELSDSPERVRRATHVILPGVGAAPEAMRRLRASGLDALIPSLRQPVLGICLGLQLLGSSSAEGDTTCLGVFEGRATRFAAAAGRPVPHMGWNQLSPNRPSPLLAGIAAGAFAYFVHSYALPPGPDTVATSDYGLPFAAVQSRGNFHGAQFHPERSAATGATLLANFLGLPS
jgi:imidazole glycerol-phosphate synthase subunit HisH